MPRIDGDGLLALMGMGCGEVCRCRAELSATLTQTQLALMAHMYEKSLVEQQQQLNMVTGLSDRGEYPMPAIVLMASLGPRPGRHHQSTDIDEL